MVTEVIKDVVTEPETGKSRPYSVEGTKDVVTEPGTGKIGPYTDEGTKDVVTEPGTGKSRPNMYEGLEWMGESMDIEVSDSEVKKNLCNCVNTSDENWEHFWDTAEGQDPSFWVEDKSLEEVKKRKINPKIVKKLRRLNWLKKINPEDLVDMDRIWDVEEVLLEDIQNYEEKMVLVGSDVEALYPRG